MTATPNPQPIIYIVDSDHAFLSALQLILTARNFNVLTFGSAEGFLKTDINPSACCLIVDANLPRLGGIDLLEQLHSSGVDLPAIVTMAGGDIATAVRAMRAKAMDFIEKPGDPAIMANLVSGLFSKAQIAGIQ